jgi:hypothetical protein
MEAEQARLKGTRLVRANLFVVRQGRKHDVVADTDRG